MARRILQTDFTAKLDAILRGIDTRQVTAADKVLALDTALSRYSQDKPRIRLADFPGDGAALCSSHHRGRGTPGALALCGLLCARLLAAHRISSRWS